MTEFFKYFLFIVPSTVASVWIVDRFWSTFFPRKRFSLLVLIPWVLSCVSQGIVLHERLQSQPKFTSHSFFVSTLLIFLIITFGYETAGWKKYFLFLIFCSMWAMVELSLELFLHLFPLNSYANMLIGSASSAILMMAFCHLVSVFWDKKYNEINSRLYFPILLISAGSIYIMLVQYSHGFDDPLSSSIISILLIFNLIVFYLYVKLNRISLNERENAVHAEQLSLISQNIEEQKKLMEEFYAQKHDLINELTALRGKMNQDGSKAAIQELDRILEDYHGMGSVCTCGNATIDALINAKHATAAEFGITFRLQICVPEELTVAARDLGVVIGNALDNAITAVRECQSAEKVIHISMGVKKNAFIMVIKNPYEHALNRTRRGEIISTKPDAKRHGYGLRSIRRIAEAYAGDMIVDTEQGVFSLTVVLNLDAF